MGRLDGRVGIITGAAQSIGRDYAIAAATEGASVVIADILDPEPLAKELEAAGGMAFGVKVDVTSVESTQAMADAALERFGRIDFLVNNAALYGALTVKLWTDIEAEEWDQVMAVNLRGMFLCCKAVLPDMVERRSGKIINISSSTALCGVSGMLHYVTSKAGVIGLTRGLAREVGRHGITVNTITPGLTMSDGTAHLLENSGQPVSDRLLQAKCLPREQTSGDLVGALLFLASSASDFITAQILNVDGGWMVT